MKIRLLLASCVIALAACAGQLTLLDQEVLALKSVTVARQLSAAKLRAGKITAAEEQANKVKFDALAKAIKDAVAANDKPAADAARKAADDAAAALKE